MNKRGVTAFYATFAVLIVGVIGFVVWKIIQPPKPILPETTVTEIAETSTVQPELEATTERPTDDGEENTAPILTTDDVLPRPVPIPPVPSPSSTTSTTVSDTTCEKHNWAPATCVSPRKCRVCGATEDNKLNPKNHNPDANGICTFCGKEVTTTAPVTEPPATETVTSTTVCNHVWVKSAKPCAEPAVCSKCGAHDPSGKLEAHHFVESAKPCRDLPRCSVCGKTDSSASLKPHVSDNNATCKEPAHCTVCGAAIGSPNPISHRFNGNDRSKCVLCGKEFPGIQ